MAISCGQTFEIMWDSFSCSIYVQEPNNLVTKRKKSNTHTKTQSVVRRWSGWLSVALKNAMIKKNLGRKKFISAYSPLSKEARAGTWTQDLKQRSWRNAAYWLVYLGLLGYLSYMTRNTCAGMALPSVVWVPLDQLTIRRCPQIYP